MRTLHNDRPSSEPGRPVHVGTLEFTRSQSPSMTLRPSGRPECRSPRAASRWQTPTSSGQPAPRTVLGDSRRWCLPAAYRTFLKRKEVSVTNPSKDPRAFVQRAKDGRRVHIALWVSRTKWLSATTVAHLCNQKTHCLSTP